MKHLDIINSHGEKLSGVLYSKSETDTLAILCHGFQGNKNNFFFKIIGEKISKKKIDVYAFDFSGNGKSEGAFGKSGLIEQKNDLQSVIKYFKKYKKIILIGHSMGGAVSILTSTYSTRIKKIIVLNPLVFPLISFNSSLLRIHPTFLVSKEKRRMIKDLQKIERKIKNILVKELLHKTHNFIKDIFSNNTLKKDFFKQATKVNIINKIKKLKKPILIIHGRQDIVIPLTHAQYLYRNANKPKKLVIFEYMHFPITIKDNELVSKEIIRWIRKTF